MFRQHLHADSTLNHAALSYLVAPGQVAEYLGEAVQNLAGHNFTGDDTEPPKNTGAAGWKGDIHDRKTDG